MTTVMSGRMPPSSQASRELSTASLTVVSRALRGLSNPSRWRFFAKNSETEMSRCLAAMDSAVPRDRSFFAGGGAAAAGASASTAGGGSGFLAGFPGLTLRSVMVSMAAIRCPPWQREEDRPVQHSGVSAPVPPACPHGSGQDGVEQLGDALGPGRHRLDDRTPASYVAEIADQLVLAGE